MTQPNPNAILGDLYGYRTTQSAVFITVEVPLEDLGHCVALLGAPDRAKGNPVAIAALQREALQEAPGEPVEASDEPPLTKTLREHYERQAANEGLGDADAAALRAERAHPKEHRPWSTLPASQRAALMVKDTNFQMWFGGHKGEEGADRALKYALNITSKADIDKADAVRARFEEIEQNWLSFKKLPPIEVYEEVR